MYQPTLVVRWCSTPSSIMSHHYNIIILSFYGPLQMFSFLGGGWKGGFPGGSDGEESACNGGDPGSTPEGRPEGNGYPLQYSCLEKNSMDRGVWRATVHLQMFLLFYYYACLFCFPQWNFKNPEDWQYFPYIFPHLLEQESAHRKFTQYPLFA